MVLFMDFGCILLHFSLYFGTYCIAFWCKIQCVLVHIALRFGAYCDAFWCKMRCNNQQLGTIFLSFRMQILGDFSSKRNAKA